MADDLERALTRGPGGDADGARLAAAVAGRGEREGLIDVAYAVDDTPIGPLLVAGTGRGLVMVAYMLDGIEERLEVLARGISPRVVEAPARLDAVRRELDEYFDGTRRAFDVPIDWALVHGFAREVLRATAAIPYGGWSTYGEIAAAAGSPRGSRAAGNALGSNPIPIVIPCHRVMRAGGAIGGYTGGIDRKRFLLGLEEAQLTL
ncbi:MAG: methylated-DNA--[protein]-cysteine S-methyltransferase [Thermoleophilia bacterium]